MFKLLANKMLAIDPLARSSMWEDLEAGRKTEIDYLNGEVIALAESLDSQAPVNQSLIELIRDAENGGRRGWSASDLRQQLHV
jgi:2-dehydropantoate 2-reductase